MGENQGTVPTLQPSQSTIMDMEACDTQRPHAVGQPAPSPKAGIPKRFRRLEWNEVVCRGDFVADERLGLEPWEGPSGFRADAFVKPIYRRSNSRAAAATKPK
jgi:hypothetical protein